MRSTAIRWNFREYRFPFTLQFLSLQSGPLGTVSIQGFSPSWGDIDSSLIFESLCLVMFFFSRLLVKPGYPTCGPD